jgi:peroxiredoxin
MAELIEAGTRAPGFSLLSLAGDVLTLETLLAHGKPVLLAFLKVSCPVCQMTFPFLERMSRGGVQMAAISQDHDGATRNFNSRFGVSFTSLLDTESGGYAASNAYGISHVPTAFLIEPDGEVSLVMEGFVKRQMEEIGQRAGVPAFAPGEYVPEWKSG